MTRKHQKFEDYLIEKLKDPIEAKAFLDAAIFEYEEDKDSKALMLALDYLVKASGGVAKLAKKSGLNRQNLFKVLGGKTTPRLDTAFDIINGLGFHLTSKPINKMRKKERGVDSLYR